jgi:hypothetical protein
MIVFVWQLLQIDLRIFYNRLIHGIFKNFYDKYVAVDMGACACKDKDANDPPSPNLHQQPNSHLAVGSSTSTMSANNNNPAQEGSRNNQRRRGRSSSPHRSARPKLEIDKLVLQTLGLIRTLVEK